MSISNWAKAGLGSMSFDPGSNAHARSEFVNFERSGLNALLNFMNEPGYWDSVLLYSFINSFNLATSWQADLESHFCLPQPPEGAARQGSTHTPHTSQPPWALAWGASAVATRMSTSVIAPW